MHGFLAPFLALQASTTVVADLAGSVAGTPADPVLAEAFPRRQLGIDLDNDGNDDVYHVSTARTSTPKSTAYEAYVQQVAKQYDCPNGYYGHECAKRTCAYGASWLASGYMASDPADEVYAAWGDANTGGMHTYQMCSGKGTCNRETGKCSCFDGYYGKGCRYKTCPNDCGDHGVCQPAYVVNSDYQSTISNLRFVEQYWDADRSFRCVCDSGYTGIDCSDRMCPTGLDPVDPYDCIEDSATPSEFYGFDQQVIKFPDTFPEEQYFFLEFETAFGGTALRTRPVQYDSSQTNKLVGEIQSALEALPNGALNTVQTRLLDSDFGYTVTVQVAFTDATTTGRQSLLSCVAPSPTDGAACESGAQPTLESINVGGVDCETEYYNLESDVYTSYQCSSRGECDHSNGKCECHSGFEGLRCETMYTFY